MTDTAETREYDGIELRKVREFVWEIPQEGEMNAPARVLASDPLLEQIGDDKTLQQLRNATHLPGITTYAACMPDGHQGYGFPVGGVGATDARDGCISPGAVGYDINCLSGDSEVEVQFGRRRTIRGLESDFEEERAIVPAGDDAPSSTIRLFTETDDRTVYQVETIGGDTVEATTEHPFETPEGMVELDELDSGDEVYVRSFRGIPDGVPAEFTVLDESDFEDEDPQLVEELRSRELLPLQSTDEAFARLLKLVGYHTGDGSFSGTQSWFYGEPEDLEAIRDDIESIGFTPSRVYERDREHEIDGAEFERTEYSIKSGANALKQLLVRLGAPEGRKTASDFTAPQYLDRLADWQVALYLSTFFGAEMSAPDTVSAKNFYAPSVSHNRLVEKREAGKQFMQDLIRHLNELGIETNEFEVVERTETTGGETVRFRFGVSSEASNLVEFLTTVGYRYNQEKRRSAALAAEYLRRKERVITERARIAEEAQALADGGTATAEIKRRFADEPVNDRYIERSVYSGRSTRPRPPAEFPDFEEFQEETPVRNDGAVLTEISDIRQLGEKPVYDIGVSHDAHAFAAEGFVVSNCGVRMIRTNLTYEDIQGNEEELVESLFANVPSGLGGGGIVEGDADTVEAVLERGMEWALEEGYATEDDLAHCEDEGRRPDARPEFVSQKAKDRGRNQLGSLGSGNHFLEVQRVTDVFDEAVADSFGLEEDQIVVLIHCGSRGLGHQVCTDYLRRIEKGHGDLLESLPDKELAAAPAGSELADEYYGAMCAAINFAWVNRQLITHRTRRVFERVFRADAEELGMELLYDVAHNIAKKEVHDVGVDDDGTAVPTGDAIAHEERELYVHRKGATRAFPAGHEEVPAAYRDVGQPVIIPGSMGAGSYVLVGGDESLAQTFGSTAHGAGRVMSRTAAKQEYWGETVQDELRDQDHIYVKAQSGATVAEEAPGVYKDVDEVVRVSDALGIGDKVARTFPVCNIKG
ncbi:RtcB family protein [Halobaculum rubrum]|uniref:RtcB family protein n=1 Tax=Halobaculum rubrum TaxID=2872158 RepID=UPI001CA3E867|nr:RtcB family protein [Halobaculum rubrum]QZX99515.1 RtcB family protein [Halobaculum rubrum]